MTGVLRRTWQRCADCGHEIGELARETRCPECHGLLEILHAGTALSAEQLKQRFLAHPVTAHGAVASGVWRFQDIVLPTATSPVSWPEGNTPLLDRAAVQQWAGCPGLLLKHEGMNPTGSFKDRGMTVGVTQAQRIGASAVACASTGNTSASLAAYAAQAGLPALVFVPSGGIALGKLAQSLAYGARTLLVRGDFDDCLRLVEAAHRELGVYLLNSINPFRLEGQKTIVLELLLQLAWHSPDWIAVPAGNLGNTAAFGKALREAKELGLIARVPRIASVQASGAAPFAAAFAEDFAVRHRVRAETVATAIKIGDPASWDRAVRTIRETDGVVLAVSDAEILEAKAVIDASGVGCEPASAASVAGVRQLVRQGTIRPGERVVAVLTGHVLKDPGILLRYHQEMEPAPAKANRPVEIESHLRDVERVLKERKR
ncbi:MAG: threonine synthase [Gemmatimonadetes bacterium]|nr:threonine synthase [Gemmatimonadota bacterium]